MLTLGDGMLCPRPAASCGVDMLNCSILLRTPSFRLGVLNFDLGSLGDSTS